MSVEPAPGLENVPALLLFPSRATTSKPALSAEDNGTELLNTVMTSG
ncbi:MAG: hypothetical protein IPH96_03770 [Saprospiraceae bacterium]|nr:hypothetical protein [Saprospiraceae bacterium]